MSDVASLFNTPPKTLGHLGVAFEGLFSTLKSDEEVRKFVSNQFLEDSETYVLRHQNTDHGHRLIEIALKHIGLENRLQHFSILDIGSGAGLTAIPLLKIFPNASIVGMDISPNMLAHFQKHLKKSGDFRDRCVLVQGNAEDLDFKESSFDFVVGAAILHHLFRPEKVIESCSKILKPGGHAIFFEPFEMGYSLTAIILRQLISSQNHFLSFKNRPRLSREVVDFFKCIIRDQEARTSDDKGIYAHLDDKWLFTRDFFESHSRKLGLTLVKIASYGDSKRIFDENIEELLRQGLGKSRDAVPQWAWNIIGSYTQSFSSEARKELLTESCVILRK